MWAAAWQARLSWRAVIGLTGFIPGNSHPCGRAALYQARNSSSRCGESIFVALALFDPDHHALAVDVGYLQRNHLGHSQSGPIGHTQCHLVFEPRRRIEKTCDFFRAQDDRQFAWHVDKLGMVHDVGAPKRDLEKEPQCRDALVEGRNAGATCCQKKLIAAYVFEARGIGRAAEESGEVLDPLHVVMLGLRR